jgi:hypothetical protein
MLVSNLNGLMSAQCIAIALHEDMIDQYIAIAMLDDVNGHLL